jgi:two-component system cell cycle sensor histidine kinase/response regulator CckA
MNALRTLVADDHQLVRAGSAGVDPAADAPHSRVMKILIVDDHRLNRKLLAATLAIEGYQTLEAGDGLEALEILGTTEIAAVISDGLMPYMDGYQLCSAVRRDPRCQHVPFIFYTSTYTDPADEKLALDAGADRFLRKPVPMRELIDVVRELVSLRGSAPRGPVPAEEVEVMKQYSQTLIRKLEKRNDQLSAQAKALHHSETQLRAIFEAEPDCVCLFGRDGKVTSTNPAGLALFEVDSLAEFAGYPLLHFVAEGHRAAFNAGVEAVWQGEKSCVDFAVLGARGALRWVEMQAAPLRDQTGEIVAVLGIARDHTARKELEAQFVQAQKMEVVGQLAGGVAHDFNNMISIIMGYSEIVLDELDGASPLRAHVQTIHHTAQRAGALTRQLLIFSREEATQLQIIDLSAAVAGMDSMLRRLIGENIQLVTEPQPDLGGVEADLGQVEQVLMNLTVNARDAMPGGGTITISTSQRTVAESAGDDAPIPPGDYVVLSIADEGCGMSAEVREKIFAPFFTTKPAGKGTGLGLATCQRIVAQWSGHIAVESERGVGTRFDVYLPRVQLPAQRPATPSQSAALPRGTETILLVEDEPGLLHLAASVLAHQGYTVLKAANGQEALRIVRERDGLPIDLVLTDMVMPEMGGKLMADWLRITNPEIKLLFTSGYSQCGLEDQFGIGIEFLPKPYTPSSLVRKVREVIDQRAAGRMAPMAADTYEAAR